MKNYLLLVLFSAIIMICVPAAISKPQKTTPSLQTTLSPSLPDTTAPQQADTEDTISVFLTAEQETVDITLFEYVCGSVAAEMPLAYDEEAIKAQAVACYTNALRAKTYTTENEGNITDNTAIHQGYINESERKEKWGDDFELYEKKLQDAVRAVEGEALYYNNELCVAAFFAISPGKTEDAKNIWGNSVPYLVPAESKGDTNAKGYSSSLTLNTEDFYLCLKETDSSVKKPETLENIITIEEASPSGTVLKATLNGKEYSGEDIRKIFSLRSPAFTVKSDKDTITFSVTGYGHGVGMSQYGADYYAKEGYTYKEILAHYYKGAQIMDSNK